MALVTRRHFVRESGICRRALRMPVSVAPLTMMAMSWTAQNGKEVLITQESSTDSGADLAKVSRFYPVRWSRGVFES